jgi:hypothetical protein
MIPRLQADSCLLATTGEVRQGNLEPNRPLALSEADATGICGSSDVAFAAVSISQSPILQNFDGHPAKKSVQPVGAHPYAPRRRFHLCCKLCLTTNTPPQLDACVYTAPNPAPSQAAIASSATQ